MRSQLRCIFLVIAVGCCLLPGQAVSAVRLPRIFNSGMVLQYGRQNPIWGWAAPNERITVIFAGNIIRTKATPNGEWKTKLPAIKRYGGPYTLEVTGSNTITLDNILVGEVWLCSGQSNMEMPVKSAKDATREIAAATFPDIRLFTVPHAVSKVPVTDLREGKWEACNPSTIAGFSATAYYFARKLYGELRVPIGLIHCSWSGTNAETWTSALTVGANPDLQPALAKLADTDSLQRNNPNAFPSLLYNAMLRPVMPFGIRGAAWYQGEANTGRTLQYRTIFPDLVRDWRKNWGQGDFPFLFVLLANYMKSSPLPADSPWAELREAQAMALDLPNTGLASAVDLGEAADIHPKNKQDVGARLALSALKVAYNKKLVFSGPVVRSVKMKGNTAKVIFKHTGSGLQVKGDGAAVNGFAVAGDDRKFYWATAALSGESSVVVSSDKVANIVAIRYCWAPNPDNLNLYNKEGLPATPFRTDDWRRPGQ